MKEGITKKQSKILQGLAILMMLYHHLFSTPEALGVPYHSLLKFGSINAELHMAWFFKICVGIYAFVSGYGLCRSLCHKTKAEGFFSSLKEDYGIVLRKLLSFYLSYLLVFVIFVPIGFLFFGKPFRAGEFFLNLFGLSSTYNGAWWYVRLYFLMLLTVPLVNGLFTVFDKKEQNRIKYLFYGVLALILGGSYFLPFSPEPAGNLLLALMDLFQPAFYLCFLVGYLLARFRVYEFCYDLFTHEKNPLRDKGERILSVLGVLAFFLVIVVRVKMAKDASSAGLDFLFVPVFVFGVLKITDMIPVVGTVLTRFGYLSLFIWLTHVFYYDHYAKGIVMMSHLSLGIYLTLLAMSTLTAIALNFLLRRIEKWNLWNSLKTPKKK